MLQHRSASSSRLSLDFPDLPGKPAYTLKPGQPSPGQHSLLRPPLRSNTKYRNINLFPIDYAFRPRLRGRLTLPRLTLDRNLGLPASGLFTRFIVTHVSIRTSDTSSRPYDPPSQAYRTLPYHSHSKCESAASVINLAPLHLPRGRTRSVSYYAFFEGWLLLSQLPDCFSLSTSFST